MEEAQNIHLDNPNDPDPSPRDSQPISSGMRAFISRKPHIMAISAFAKGANNDKDLDLSTAEYYDREKVNMILQKEHRTEEDARVLYKVIKNNSFFENFLEMDGNLEAKAMLAICKQIKYEKIPAQTVVCEQGAPSNGKMYIVFSGDLNIHVKNPDHIIHQNLVLNRDEEPENLSKASETEGSTPTNSARGSTSRTMLRVNTLALDKEIKPEAVSTPTKMLGRSKRKTLVGNDITNNFPGTPLLKRKGTLTLPPTIQNPKILKGLSKLAIVSRVIASTNSRRNSKTERNFDRYGVVVDSVHKGGFFGERALIEDKPRGATVVTVTHCELLVITKDVFMSLKGRFDKKKNKILEFMIQSIPTLDQLVSKTILEKLYYLFKEQRFEYGYNVITEDTKGEHVYLLFDGECEIVKNIKVDKTMTFQSSMTQISPLIGLGKTNSQQVMLYTIPKGTFFGEEVLFHKTHKYQYTVKVSSPRATVFAIQRSKFFLRFPSSAILALKTIFYQKLASHERRLSHVISTKYKGYNEVTINDEGHEMHAPNDVYTGKPGRIIINNRGNNKESTKVIVVTKEASPYYNVFKNARPQTSEKNLEKFLACSEIDPDQQIKYEEKDHMDPYMKMIMRSPGIRNERDLYDFRGLEKVRRNSMANIKKKVSNHSFSREITQENPLSIQTRCQTEMDPWSANLLTEGNFESPLFIKSVKSAMSRPNNTSATWNNEYFNEKAPKIPPLRLEEEKTEKELMMEHAKSIQTDLAKSEMEDRRFRLKRLQLQAKLSTEKTEKKTPRHKGDRILMIKASLEARKKKYEKKTEKLKNNFKDLIQVNFAGLDEKPTPIGFSLFTIRNNSRATNSRDGIELKSSQTCRPSTVFSDSNFHSARRYPTTMSPFRFMSSKTGDLSRESRTGIGSEIGIKEEYEKKDVSLMVLTDRAAKVKIKAKKDESNKMVKTISQFSFSKAQRGKLKKERGHY